MIPTIPPEPVLWQGLVHGDNFQTSVKIEEADIYKDVGGILGTENSTILVISGSNMITSFSIQNVFFG